MPITHKASDVASISEPGGKYRPPGARPGRDSDTSSTSSSSSRVRGMDIPPKYE
jgi:hypothetical protein